MSRKECQNYTELGKAVSKKQEKQQHLKEEIMCVVYLVLFVLALGFVGKLSNSVYDVVGG